MTADLMMTEDTDWFHHGSRERYRAARAKELYEEAVKRRKAAEATVRTREDEVARVTGPGAEQWWDAHARPRYEAELAQARDRLAAALDREQETRQAWQAADALANPKPPTEAERKLAAAEAALAGEDRRLPKVNAELAGARDRLTALRQKAAPTDRVEAARHVLEVDDAEREVARLEAEKVEQERRIEWARGWVDVKQAVVDGDNTALEAALDALDEAS